MLAIFLELNSKGLYLSSEKKTILCSRQNERRERENEKWDQNKELKMKLLIGLRFMFCFSFPFSIYPLILLVWTGMVVVLSSRLIYCFFAVLVSLRLRLCLSSLFLCYLQFLLLFLLIAWKCSLCNSPWRKRRPQVDWLWNGACVRERKISESGLRHTGICRLVSKR